MQPHWARMTWSRITGGWSGEGYMAGADAGDCWMQHASSREVGLVYRAGIWGCWKGSVGHREQGLI